MPLIEHSDYRPPFWLPDGHAQSIFPALFRKVTGVVYQRERITTQDDDFLDLDWSLQQEENTTRFTVSHSPLVILSHGLEGNSSSQYILGMIKYLNNNGFDCLAWNFRSCSGEMNRQRRFYHSGATDDLDIVVKQALSKGYQELYLAGFSLGANLTLKYLGELGEKVHSQIQKAIVFSVPLHLSSGSTYMERWQAWVYTDRFNRSLKDKIRQKAALMPELIDASRIEEIRTIRDFDNLYTSQLHGYRDAEDYYEQNSSLYFVEQIRIPTLIVNAQNDPFLSKKCYPFDLMKKLKQVWFQAPRQGGHCGFYQAGYQGVLWSEQRALTFLKGKN
ncbi:MAG: alpha/beta fold hydrolase [Siphonobacter sp.]